MNKKKIGCILAAVTISLALVACGSAADAKGNNPSSGEAAANSAEAGDAAGDTTKGDAEGTAEGNATKGDAEGTAAGDASKTNASEAGEAKGTTDADAQDPAIEENFEGTTNRALERGPVTLSVVDDGVDGSKALYIDGRTDAWNGANFACDDYRGNTIRVNANVKSPGKSVRLSIQYDVDGITAYNWIKSTATTEDKYAFITGTYSVPKDAENIFVYVESDTTDPIYLDELVIKAEGKYQKPEAIAEKVMADTSSYESLKELYADSFEIGCCINPAIISKDAYSDLLIKEFSSVTMENDLKPEAILDKAASMEDLKNGGTHLVVNLDSAKEELDFAVRNKMKVRGHTLIWHSQTPDWIFYVDYDTTGKLASRELMLKRVDHYMEDVFTYVKENYDGLFYAWDIVNEAMEDNGKMRKSLWYETIGEDYVEQVFALARKYAPEDIKLFYNDYNSFQSSKQNGIIEMLKPVAKAGNIDGIGMQGHLYTGEEPEHFVKAAKRYADELGVIIHITEIDVTTPNATSPEGEHGKYYGKLFKALKDAKANGVPIESVSVWGLTDSLSWKAGDKPLLFNGDLSAKQAFFEVVGAAKK